MPKEDKKTESTLYVVATPIGNLGDIGERALNTLREVDYIIAEDTRKTGTMLSSFGIKNSYISYHSKSNVFSSEKIIDLLLEGKNLALVTDAGTPAISDPGSKLLKEIRDNHPEINIFTIPGPSAIIASLSVSGAPSNKFTFFGFMPTKKGKLSTIKEILSTEHTCVFYESPHRIIKTISEIKKEDNTRKILVSREMTKIYEEHIYGYPEEVIKELERKTVVKGEITVVVYPRGE